MSGNEDYCARALALTRTAPRDNKRDSRVSYLAELYSNS